MPRYPDSNRDTSEDSGGTPRSVYMFGIIAIVLVLLFVIVHLTVGALGSHES